MSVYVLDRPTLQRLPATEGLKVFVWTDDEDDEIFGQIAQLQHVVLGGFTGWRAQPLDTVICRGKKPPGL